MSQYATLQAIGFSKQVTQGIDALVKFVNIVIRDGKLTSQLTYTVNATKKMAKGSKTVNGQVQ